MGDRGLFTVPSVEILNYRQYSGSMGWINSDRTPKDLDITSFPVSFSAGVMARLMVTATFDLHRHVKASNLVQSGFNPSYPYVSTPSNSGVGDFQIAGKYRVWRQRDNIGGMAVRGFMKFGAADARKGLGTGKTDVGFEGIFSSQLPWKFHDAVMHSSMGFVETGNADLTPPLTLKNELRSGLGVAYPSMRPIQGIFEYTTTTFVGAGSSNPAPLSVQNISDVSAGVRYLMLDRGVTVNAGYRINTKFDLKFPNNQGRNGFVFGVSYTQPVATVGNNHFPVIALAAETTEIRAGESTSITASGYDADNDSLVYSWTSSGGQVEGTGEKVTFRANGIPAGKYTIRVTASDGKGGVATSQIEITVRQ